MNFMAKKKPPESEPKPEEAKKPYPSRLKIRYVGLPLDLYELLLKYAGDHSDEDSKKSASWAARVAVRQFFKDKPK